jgi:hypothetical protein
VTALYHTTVSLEDGPMVDLVRLADGTRSREALRAALVEAILVQGGPERTDGTRPVPPEEARALVERSFDRTLERLGRMGLLAGPASTAG